MKTSDRQKAVKNKDFTGIYNAFYTEIYFFILSKIHDKMLAEDLTSEVFVKVYEKLNTYDETKRFNTWLYNVALHHLIDYLRKEKKYDNNISISDYVDNEGKETLQFEATYNDVNDIESKELRNSISKAFEGLKPKYKKIATLLFLEQKKYDEIAEICNIPIGSVKGMINRCRAMLQNQLQNQRIEYSM